MSHKDITEIAKDSLMTLRPTQKIHVKAMNDLKRLKKIMLHHQACLNKFGVTLIIQGGASTTNMLIPWTSFLSIISRGIRTLTSLRNFYALCSFVLV